MNKNIGRWLIYGGLGFAGYWLWQRRNLNSQITVGSPKFKGINRLALPVSNISDVDVTFDGFVGNVISYYNSTTGVVIGTATIQTPRGGTIIKAKDTTELEVKLDLNLLGSGSVIWQLIQGGKVSEANIWLKGNYFIMGNIKVEYSEKIL